MRCQNNMTLKLKRTPGIYLVGFMGCGKSTVGRALADELGWSFFDIDTEIESSAGSTISEIFDKQGEPVFRALEAAALAKRVKTVQAGRPQVIALGGGALMDDNNFELIANHGVVVWLDAPFDLIERRVAAESHRPLARHPEKLRELFEIRSPRYALADFRVEAPDEEAIETARRILALPLF
jgi:shikimate kinase